MPEKKEKETGDEIHDLHQLYYHVDTRSINFTCYLFICFLTLEIYEMSKVNCSVKWRENINVPLWASWFLASVHVFTMGLKIKGGCYTCVSLMPDLILEIISSWLHLTKKCGIISAKFHSEKLWIYPLFSYFTIDRTDVKRFSVSEVGLKNVNKGSTPWSAPVSQVSHSASGVKPS